MKTTSKWWSAKTGLLLRCPESTENLSQFGTKESNAKWQKTVVQQPSRGIIKTKSRDFVVRTPRCWGRKPTTFKYDTDTCRKGEIQAEEARSWARARSPGTHPAQAATPGRDRGCGAGTPTGKLGRNDGRDPRRGCGSTRPGRTGANRPLREARRQQRAATTAPAGLCQRTPRPRPLCRGPDGTEGTEGPGAAPPPAPYCSSCARPAAGRAVPQAAMLCARRLGNRAGSGWPGCAPPLTSRVRAGGVRSMRSASGDAERAPPPALTLRCGAPLSGAEGIGPG